MLSRLLKTLGTLENGCCLLLMAICRPSWLWRRSVSQENALGICGFSQASLPRRCFLRDPSLPSVVSVRTPSLWSLVMLLQGNMHQEISLKRRDYSQLCQVTLERAWQCFGFHDDQVTVSSPLALETASSFWEQLRVCGLLWEGRTLMERGKKQLLFQKQAQLPILNCWKVREECPSKDAEGSGGPPARRGGYGQATPLPLSSVLVMATVRFQYNHLHSNSQQLTFVSLLFPSLYSKGENIHSEWD